MLTPEQAQQLGEAMVEVGKVVAPGLRRLSTTLTDFAQHAVLVLGPAVRAANEGLSTWGKALLPLIEKLAELEATRPPNWPSLLTYPLMDRLAREGFPVAWVPGPDVLDELMRIGSPDVRGQALLARSEDVLRHAHGVLDEVTNDELKDYVVVLRQALACVETSYAPAQALSLQAAAALAAQETKHANFASLRRFLDSMKEMDAYTGAGGVKAAMTLLAVAPILERFVSGIDLPPTTPNRHAVAHIVSLEQYTPVNAMLSVLVAVSVLRQAQENRQISGPGDPSHVAIPAPPAGRPNSPGS
ncbi:hypothetical protein ASH01_11440 [Terrabacter sp. Soil811]|uniref:hypothetical protein n=1 Tax=Terrabacter sp. Soil811 TaxID=1736419 RepID=UPI0006F96099|nr:hypothetical protein [Terrabacter sp. Soil811]KRF44598.1 hypothetical protein ASH01_11440 [Terrabacter sp. Soil811]